MRSASKMDNHLTAEDAEGAERKPLRPEPVLIATLPFSISAPSALSAVKLSCLGARSC